jgi:hypothetical protein
LDKKQIFPQLPGFCRARWVNYKAISGLANNRSLLPRQDLLHKSTPNVRGSWDAKGGQNLSQEG